MREKDDLYLFVLFECESIFLFNKDLIIVVDMFHAEIKILFMTRKLFDFGSFGNIFLTYECNEDTTFNFRMYKESNRF